LLAGTLGLAESAGYGSLVVIDIPGLLVGHWSDLEALTGVTVILLPDKCVASGEIRGGAPATREFTLLDPQCLVDRVDAVVLSGGSAFGLAAADGVMAELEASGRGFPTAAGPVPIVVAMSLFDLGVGSAAVRPGADEGRYAWRSVSADPPTGRVGAGTGATIGKWRGSELARPGGFAMSTVRHDELIVTAIVAVNAAGDVGDTGAEVAAMVANGCFGGWPERGEVFASTTIGAVVTNASLDKSQCFVVAQGAHDGLSRAITPPHLRTDGDAFVAAATGAVDAHVDDVRFAAVIAVEKAVRSVVDTLDA